MLTLHHTKGTVSGVVAVTLFEAGIPFVPVRVDFSVQQQRDAEYLAINPKGRVPALTTDRGVLTETAAILDYVAALAPQAGLVPEDAFDAARMRSVMVYLASTMHVNHAHKMRGHRWADRPESWEDMRAKVPQTMTESAAYIETHALDGPFVLGDRISLADPYLYRLCSWLEGDEVDMARFPGIRAFLTLMGDRPSVRRAYAEGFL